MMRMPPNKWLIMGALGLAVAGVAVLSSQIDHSREPSGWSMFGTGYYSYGAEPNATLMPEEMSEPGHTLSAEELAQEVAEMDKFHDEQWQKHPELFVEDLQGSGAKNGGKRNHEAHVEFATLNINNAQVDIGEPSIDLGGLLGSQDIGIGIVQTGIEAGPVKIEIRTLEEAPLSVETGWEDISEISFGAGKDARTSIRGDEAYSNTDQTDWVQRLDAHGEGWYRMRVHAKGRDTETGDWVKEPVESYLFISWPAEKADPIVHQAKSEFAKYLISAAATATLGSY